MWLQTCVVVVVVFSCDSLGRLFVFLSSGCAGERGTDSRINQMTLNAYRLSGRWHSMQAMQAISAPSFPLHFRESSHCLPQSTWHPGTQRSNKKFGSCEMMKWYQIGWTSNLRRSGSTRWFKPLSETVTLSLKGWKGDQPKVKVSWIFKGQWLESPGSQQFFTSWAIGISSNFYRSGKSGRWREVISILEDLGVSLWWMDWVALSRDSTFMIFMEVQA